MTIPIVLEMSPIAFGMESDLANTGITRVCREILSAIDSNIELRVDTQRDFYVYSSESRWHNQLLLHAVSHLMHLNNFKPLMDPCDISLASCIDSHSGFQPKKLRRIAEPWIQKLNQFGPTAYKFLSQEKYIYLTSYLPCPDFVRVNKNALIVHHVHDIFPITRPSLFHGGIDSLWKNKAADFYSTDRYICISNYTSQDLMKAFPFIPEQNITVIPNSGDHALRVIDKFSPLLLQAYDLRPYNYFITVSTLEPRKNLPLLLKAFREFKFRYHTDHKLVCIGAKGWMSEEEQQMIDANISTGDVILPGRLDDYDTFALMQAATAYVSTAKCEGFGLGLAEAMSIGCLPIAPTNTSQIEVVEGIGLLFTSMETLVTAMKQASLSQHSPEEIMQKAKQRYSWERSAHQFISLFDSI